MSFSPQTTKVLNIVTYVLVALVTIGAIVGVIYGWVTHEEPGLVGACWEGDRVHRYEVDGADDCEPLLWPAGAFPLLVGVRSDNPHPPADPERAVRRVVERINDRLDFEALRLDTSDEGLCLDHHAVCVEAEVPHERGFMDEHGDARHQRTPVGMRCTARTSNTGTAELFGLVLEHELGHCLGLAHDNYDQSIMRASQYPTPDRVIPPWITDHDRGLLRTRYHGAP